MERTTVVRATNLLKTYDDDVVAVDGLDLAVYAGECFGLLGPNGAGKTTTVEILEGLVEASGGEVEILGMHYGRDSQRIREHIGLSLQHTHLPDKLRVREIVELFRALFAHGRSVEATIALVALEEKSEARYETLSGGQKQRVAVACALVSDPKVLFLDEPTTGLDPQSRRMLWDVIERYKQGWGSVVLTTHYMDEAERLCDRIGIMDHGKMIALGTPRELIDALGAGHMVQITAEDALSADLLERARTLTGVQSASAESCTAQFAIDNLHVALPALLTLLAGDDVRLSDLSTRRASIEDVFVKLTGRQLRD